MSQNRSFERNRDGQERPLPMRCSQREFRYEGEGVGGEVLSSSQNGVLFRKAPCSVSGYAGAMKRPLFSWEPPRRKEWRGAETQEEDRRVLRRSPPEKSSCIEKVPR